MISAFDYQVNNLGQRTSVATSGSEFAVATGWQWGYDALGQVKSAAHATNSAFHRSYRYDDIGNRKQSSPELQLAPAATTNYAPNLLNQYSSSITPPGAAAFNPGYDEDGNQLSAFRAPSSAFQYEWDGENRLKLIRDALGNVLVRYAYDAQSRLIRRTQPGPGTTASASTGYVNNGWNCVAQYNLLTQPALLMRRQTWGSDLSRTMQGAGGVGGERVVTHPLQRAAEPHLRITSLRPGPDSQQTDNQDSPIQQGIKKRDSHHGVSPSWEHLQSFLTPITDLIIPLSSAH